MPSAKVQPTIAKHKKELARLERELAALKHDKDDPVVRRANTPSTALLTNEIERRIRATKASLKRLGA